MTQEVRGYLFSSNLPEHIRAMVSDQEARRLDATLNHAVVVQTMLDGIASEPDDNEAGVYLSNKSEILVALTAAYYQRYPTNADNTQAQHKQSGE